MLAVSAVTAAATAAPGWRHNNLASVAACIYHSSPPHSHPFATGLPQPLSPATFLLFCDHSLAKAGLSLFALLWCEALYECVERLTV